MKIDIWSDVACPWCYIGKRRFARALDAFPHRDEVSVTWHSYQLDPSLPQSYEGSEVDYLAASKGMPRAKVEEMLAHVAEQAAAEGLDYDWDNVVVTTSLPAHHLIQLARATEGANDEAVQEGLFSAHFVEGRSISDPDVLASIGAEAGLDRADVLAALEDPRIEAEIKEDIARARLVGVQGVPFFVIDDQYGISGAQPTEMFASALAEIWAASHPLQMAGQAGESCGVDGCN